MSGRRRFAREGGLLTGLTPSLVPCTTRTVYRKFFDHLMMEMFYGAEHSVSRYWFGYFDFSGTRHSAYLVLQREKHRKRAATGEQEG
ncbi:MAG: hypothetical protein WEA04_03435 [Candidatus Andersenbacteria bacterium]